MQKQWCEKALICSLYYNFISLLVYPTRMHPRDHSIIMSILSKKKIAQAASSGITAISYEGI